MEQDGRSQNSGQALIDCVHDHCTLGAHGLILLAYFEKAIGSLCAQALQMSVYYDCADLHHDKDDVEWDLEGVEQVHPYLR